MKLDSRDKKLLDLMYINSRQSYVQLGRKLRLSNTAVQRRLAQLLQEGIIFFPMANVNFARLGLKSYRLYLKFDSMDKKTEEEILKVFEDCPRTLWGITCEGEYDVLWRVLARDEFEVERAFSLMTEKFGSKIVEKSFTVTLYQTYLSWSKALGTERIPALPADAIASQEQPDVIDMALLRELYGNSRAGSVELSSKVNLTPDAVNYRIKRLEKKGLIMGYTAWFDARKLGFNYCKFLIGFRSITKEKEKQLLRFCSQNENVVFINRTMGSWDIELDIIVRDNSELHAFTSELRSKFSGIIGRHAVMSAVEERMLNPLRGESHSI